MKLNTQSSVWQKIDAHRVMLLLIAGAVLLVGGYAFWSKVTWDGYEHKFTRWHADTKAQITKALSLPVTNEQERQKKFEALKQGSGNITTAKDSLCSMNNLASWQRVIKELHAREQKCQEMIDTVVTFSEKLQAATMYLESEQALAKIISSVPAQTELTEKDWQTQGAAWHDTADKVGKLATHTDFEPTKQAAFEAAKKIDAAWQEVVAAHTAKDQSKYANAQAQLASAYGALDTMATVSEQQLKKALDPLQPAYEKAFQ